MGFFDSIKHAFNPEVKETFDYLIKNYYKGLKSFCESSGTNTYIDGYHIQIPRINLSKPSYSDMKRIYDAKDAIIKIHETIILSEKIDADKKKLKELKRLYPHAFVYFCNECLGGVIYDGSIKMPGERISLGQQNIYDKLRVYSVVSLVGEKKCYYGNQYSPIPNNHGRTPLYNKTSYQTEPKSIDDLIYTDIQKILTKKNQFASKEKEIIESLRKEAIQIKYRKEVLNNKRRACYYKNFLISKKKNDNDIEYLTEHLSELDQFIIRSINEQYESIYREFPLGIFEYNKKKFGNETELDKKERAINSLDIIKRLNEAKKKYNQLKAKYPIGLSAFEKNSSYDDEKQNEPFSVEEIIKHEDEIKKYQINSKEASFYDNWEQSQIEFSRQCRNLRDTALSGWGCYKYDIPFSRIKGNGDKAIGKFGFWQMFCESFSEDSTVDSSFYPQKNENRKWIPQLLNNTAHYNTNIYDKILGYIEKIKENYSQEDNICVMLACMGHDNRNEIIDFHFKYLIQELDKRGIKHSLIKESPLFVDDQVRYVVIDLVTYNAQMKENVSMLLNVKRDCREFCTKEIRYKCFSDVVYITLLKGFDKQEMLNLNETKANEIKKKEAEKRKQEEEEKRKERERQQEEQKIRNEIQSLKNCVSGWNKLCFILPYNYLLPYYPTTCDFEATPEEWNDRWLVWNFKNTPGKTTRLQHEQALSNLIPRLIRLLQDAFGSKLSQLTLVCIPAASKINNETRFKDFSQRLCEQTDMKNGYGYIEIIKDATPKHLGGTGVPTLQFDENYFKGKKILLFDDIITKGNSMLRFKQKLESLGATIIAGISIGKTKHER